MSPRIKPKTCATCGVGFSGGSVAIYCPACRAERIRDRDRKRNSQHREKARKIGSTDLCVVCGVEYVVKSGMQKYCPTCQITETKKCWQESFIRQYHGNPVRRQEMLDNSIKWAKNNQERVKNNSHRNYLNNIADINDKRRKRYGFKLRPLGRVEPCPKCGNNFIVHERNQKYCDGCQTIRRDNNANGMGVKDGIRF